MNAEQHPCQWCRPDAPLNLRANTPIQECWRLQCPGFHVDSPTRKAAS